MRRPVGVVLLALACLAGTPTAGWSATAPVDSTAAWSPPHGRTLRFAATLAVGGAAALAVRGHEDPEVAATRLHDSFLYPMFRAGNTYGGGWIIGGGSLAVTALGAACGDTRLRTTGLDLARSFILASAASAAIKFPVDRERPAGGGLSFPSGHTTVAFCVVPVIARDAGWKWGVPAVAMATFTACGRMAERRHYLSDVLFGAALGYACGDVIAARRPSPWRPYPVVTARWVAVGLSF